ncbi:protein SLOW GREEN 1, chloroplastic [Euphorbia lathyris]|uniref:protein SLOW GREEN 1, chloroplastic n=1 Tax=Euphorbia lathyris TaxID=212925 RepID=UPI0033138D8A
MNSSSTLSLTTSFLHFKTPNFNNHPPPSLVHFKSPSLLTVKASSNGVPILQTLKTFAKAAIFIGVTASMASVLPAVAETNVTLSEQSPDIDDVVGIEGESENQNGIITPVSKLIESNSEAIESLKSLLQQKLDNGGEDDEALKILSSLAEAQPSVIEWKFLMARLLNEMGRNQDARKVFEEILSLNPLSFEALFENALLMDRSGEGEAVIRRLQEALDIAEEENRVKEARDVKFIMAQIQFLQKNVEEALSSYQELSKEDPGDFRPYFCRGMIYSLIDRNEEAREQFAKYRELSPKKFDVEGYLRTPLSRMKLFGSNEEK